MKKIRAGYRAGFADDMSAAGYLPAFGRQAFYKLMKGVLYMALTGGCAGGLPEKAEPEPPKVTRRWVFPDLGMEWVEMSAPARVLTEEENRKLDEEWKKEWEKREARCREMDGTVRDAARVHRVISFGESHASTTDDEFVTLVLPMLRESGFRYLAVEVDAADQKHIDDYLAGRIDAKTAEERIGYLKSYTQRAYERMGITGAHEHPWLDMMKKAHELGMRIVAFDFRIQDDDDSMTTSNEREEGQFRNLKEKIFDTDPEARVAVFVGGWHIQEDEFVDVERDDRTVKVKTVGRRLTEFTDGSHCTFSLCGSGRGNPQRFDYSITGTEQIDFKVYRNEMLRNQQKAHKTQHRQSRKQSRGRR